MISYDSFEKNLDRLTRSFANADPFPHIQIDGLLDSNVATRAAGDFPAATDLVWMNFTTFNTNKMAITDMDCMPLVLVEIVRELNSERFCGLLSEITGNSTLVPDDELHGGGLHCTKSGGYLRVHTDFASHPNHGDWARRVNLILFLNQTWISDYGGQLELWSTDATQCMRRVSPEFNRAVIFNTTDESFHGYPDPVSCPAGVSRNSIALYYYTRESHPLKVRVTEFVARPEDSIKVRLSIRLEKVLLRTADYMKRYLGIKDAQITRILNVFKSR